MSLPNGMTVFESRLLPTSSGALACIGGPVEALNQFCNNSGVKNTLNYMSYLINNVKYNPPKIEAFPIIKKQFVDPNIPGIE